MSSPYLPLTPVVNVTVIVAPPAATPPQFNQGLVVGSSVRIPYATRVVQFASLAAMLTYGFQITDPEYICASLYFSQNPTAQYVWIGLQNTTSLKTVIPHSGAAGTNYVVGDVILVNQGGANSGYVQVTTIGGGGAVTGLSVVATQDGTGYATATGLTTTGGSGTGLDVDITAIGESSVVAVQNCRGASPVWYAFTVAGINDAADHEALALFAQSATPATFYMGTTADAAVLTNAANNVAAVLKAANYSRTALIYSTTQGGAAPNNAYAAAALMGSVNGQNDGLPNSYFTEWGKVLVGITPEPLTQTQVNTINGFNCNVYVGYVGSYTIVQPGITPSGVYIDQQLNRDILSAAIQYAVMNLLYDSSAIPLTDPGEQQLIHAINTACQAAVVTGYLAPGTYEGAQPILNLQPGDPMPAGYVTQALPFSQQSTTARQARQSMPLYVVVNEADAIQSATIGVYINP
jgi:hypothetical protein